jgi:flavorubredoxin
MSKTIKISDNIYWLGVNDRRTTLFENYWPIPKGVAYNSYVIVDEKTAIIDTIDRGMMDDYMDNIENAINGRPVDYLIINHMEPDHSGAIKAIVSKYPNIQIVGNKKTFPMLERFYGIKDNLLEVKEGDSIDLGTHKLNFAMIPMVHWPETMVTYESTNKILFSGDAFGSFGTLDGGIFDYQVDLDWLEEEMSRYYSNIVGKYGGPTQSALKKVAALEVDMICATHGPIWKEHIPEIIAKYDKWSKYETDKGVVIVFASMYGNTEKMADYIARELVNQGIEKVRIFDASKTHPSYIINEIFKYRGVILGSATYNGGLFPAMNTLVSELDHMGIKNHIMSIFGSHAWAGAGVKNLLKFSESIKWELVGEPCDSKCSPHEEEYCKCKNIASDMAKRLNELY